jgi:hypothetical protein
MRDEWRCRFLEDGELEIRVSRARGGLGMLAGAIAFGIPTLYFLWTPGSSGMFGLGGLRFAGVLGLVLVLPALYFAVRILARPMLLLRLTQDGLETMHAPLATWDEVQGARPWRAPGGLTLASIALAPSYWDRVEAQDPALARRLRGHAVGGGDRKGHVVVPGGAPGGSEALVELVLWARHQVQQPR